MHIRHLILVGSVLCLSLSAGAQEKFPGRPNLSLGVHHRAADSSLVSKLNVGLLGRVDTLQGFQLSLLTGSTERLMHGMNVGGLLAVSYGQAYGMQAAGLISSASGDFRGVQIGGISNIAHRMQGVQMSLLSNETLSPFRGTQVSLITNIAQSVKSGLQLSGVANISAGYMRGTQIGTYNYADTLRGVQVGLFNIAVHNPKGLQVGLVNYNRDSISHRIGLVNVNPHTKIDFMTFVGNSSKLNFAVRFRNRSTYSILGIGTHYMGLDEKFSGALFYRLGQYFPLSARWSLSGDIGYYHIETFQENSITSPERLFSLQAHLNADYQLTRHLGAYASVGWGDTRYYNHFRSYRSRPVVQLGLTYRYDQHVNDLVERSRKTLAKLDNPIDSVAPSIYAYQDPHRQGSHPWKAAGEVTMVNAFVHCFDRFVLNEDFAQNNIHNIRNNFKNAFVWDNDNFLTNLFAHPYHGNLYFNSARSSGLNFWQSYPYALGGSLMWEFFGETTPPAINDVMATSIGGSCIGEVTFRISDLIYDDRTRGIGRFFRELLGGLVSPMKEFNRLISGDAWRVRHSYYSYHDYQRIPVSLTVTTGLRYLADEGKLFRGETNPFFDLMLDYGDAMNEDTNKPYDYFTANVTFGLSGNQPLVNGVHLLGRLWGSPIFTSRDLNAQVGIFQHFNFYNSEEVKDGSGVVPYRISEAASVGPGIIMRFENIGNLSRLEQRIFLDGILLGGSLSDYLHIQERDYNMGSGFSAKSQTVIDFGRYGGFTLNADFYRIFTWKGYDADYIQTIDQDYTNTQGDVGNATMLVINPRIHLHFSSRLSFELYGAYYYRHTHYKYHDAVYSHTYEMRGGLSYRL